MTAPDVELRDVEVRDVPAVAAVAAQAFLWQELWAALVPDPEQRLRVLRAMFAPLITDAVRRDGFVRMAVGGDGVVGVAVWPAPGRHNPRWWRQLRAFPTLSKHLDRAALRRLSQLGSQVQRMLEDARPKERHAYLALVGITPTAQGSGVGTLLAQDGLEHVDSYGLPTYLECERHLQPYYERFDFTERNVLSVPDEDVPDQLGMWREPARASS